MSKRVLIIEDSSICASNLSRIIKKFTKNIDISYNGRDASKKILKKNMI